MSFEAAFRSLLQSLSEEKQSAIYSKIGMPQSTFSHIVNNPKKQPQLTSIGKIIDGFDKETFLSFLRAMRPDFPVEVIDMEGKRDVKVYDISELNKAFNVDGLDNLSPPSQFKPATHSLKQLFSVRVPVEFFPSDVGVRVVGHGLEPIIPDGSAVGLSYLKSWADFVAGEIYLCNLPFEGLVLRQVVVAQDHAGLEFQQLHPDKTRYRSQIHHQEKARDMIIARKTWTATRG